VFSPTYIYADIRKKKTHTPEERAKRLTAYNHRYLATSILFLVGLSTIYCRPVYNSSYGVLYAAITVFVIWLLPFSRCNEIFFAFIRDALDKFDKKSSSSLTYRQRIELAFFSYFELIFNFAIIYFVLPVSFFKDFKGFSNVLEAIYFSEVTITTIGYGDISPKHWLPQLLTVYEVFCGFILLLVCFTIYTSKGLSSNNEK
jgi:voltage-gated potassium channel